MEGNLSGSRRAGVLGTELHVAQDGGPSRDREMDAVRPPTPHTEHGGAGEGAVSILVWVLQVKGQGFAESWWRGGKEAGVEGRGRGEERKSIKSVLAIVCAGKPDPRVRNQLNSSGSQ